MTLITLVIQWMWVWLVPFGNCEFSNYNYSFGFDVYDGSMPQYMAIGGDNGIAINWYEARTYCLAMYNVDLASIHSYDDNTKIYTAIDNLNHSQYLSPTTCWIGLFDEYDSGSWSWSDRSDVDYTRYDTFCFFSCILNTACVCSALLRIF